MKTEPKINLPTASLRGGREGSPTVTSRRRLFDAAPPSGPHKEVWGNVLRNLRSGSEDGIQNAMLLIAARDLCPGPALARLHPPRPSLLTCKASERREIEALLSAAISEAEALASKDPASF